LPVRRVPDQARDMTRQMIFRFGQLLIDWPDIVEAARILRRRGLRLARCARG
jgi:hypothetical protein